MEVFLHCTSLRLHKMHFCDYYCLYFFENDKNVYIFQIFLAPISLSCLQLIAESLNELSVSALDSFARLLKFEDGLENLALKGFKGWKLVTVMILEWERSSSIEEQKTLLFLKQKLSVLRDDSTGNDQDIVKVALEKLHIHFQA